MIGRSADVAVFDGGAGRAPPTPVGDVLGGMCLMPQSGCRSIGKSVTVALVLTVAVGGVAATALHEAVQRRESRAAAAAAATDLARLMADRLSPNGPTTPVAVQSACDQFVQHPSVVGVMVWNQAGRLSGTAVSEESYLPLFDTAPDVATSDGSVELVSVPGASRAIRRVDVALGSHFQANRPGRLSVFIRSSGVVGAPWTRVGRFVIPLAIAGFVILLAAWAWFRANVIRPVRALHEAMTTGKVGDARVSPTSRRDELGAIARSVLELHGRAAKSQEQADRIERSLDSRVADETRRIQRDMRKIERQSWIDPLTGVNNRRMLEEKFGAIFEAQRRAQCDLSVIMMDIDHFKILNDTLGHRAGDEMLAFTGELIQQCLRTDDCAIRYGGDEFLLLLPGVAIEQAQTVAGRIIALFAQRARLLDVKKKPSMSAGVASQMNNEPASSKEIIELADQALYEAKQSGKNTVRMCQNLERLAPLAS